MEHGYSSTQGISGLEISQDGIVLARNIFSNTRNISGLEISQDGIVLARNGDGRVTGEAYVLFSDEDNFQRAMTRNREHIGKRYEFFVKINP